MSAVRLLSICSSRYRVTKLMYQKPPRPCQKAISTTELPLSTLKCCGHTNMNWSTKVHQMSLLRGRRRNPNVHFGHFLVPCNLAHTIRPPIPNSSRRAVQMFNSTSQPTSAFILPSVDRDRLRSKCNEIESRCRCFAAAIRNSNCPAKTKSHGRAVTHRLHRTLW